MEARYKNKGGIYPFEPLRLWREEDSIDIYLILALLVAMTEAKRNPPFRAEHLGSLLRPKELQQKHALFEKKEIGQAEVTEVENESVDKIVKVQLDAGFRAVSDGEYRYVILLQKIFCICPGTDNHGYSRAVFWGTFFEELEGMTEIRNPSMDIFRPYVPDIAGFLEKGHRPGQSCVCTGKIRHTGKSTLINQFEYLKTLIPEERWGDIKLTMIAPPWYHLRYKEGNAFPTDVYPTDEAYFADIAVAVQTELDILYEAGLRNVQFDDPNFACKAVSVLNMGHADLDVRFLLREDAQRMGGRQIELENTRRVA
jgi:methionine synthase II (cobalamin-independent)